MKDEARAMALAAVQAGGFGSREVVIRINGLDTPWGAEDLAMAGGSGADAVLAPKVGAPADVLALDRGLSGQTRLWAMIETCAAVFALDAIGACAATTRLSAWVIGTNDLAKEMRCRPGVDREPLLAPLSLAVAAARAHGLAILDGVFNEIDDAEGYMRQCRQGLAFGFDGKTLIHPRQIEMANLVFSPGPDEVAWARAVVGAFELAENSAKGVIRLEGRMVERLHLAEAHRLLAVAAAIEAHRAGG
jgi:citrate lyase subunit beta/citryl-CoA lyase